jgi:hypothetical protein
MLAQSILQCTVLASIEAERTPNIPQGVAGERLQESFRQSAGRVNPH